MDSFNCSVCGKEDEMSNFNKIALNKKSNFKICLACLSISDPKDGYEQAKQLIKSYKKFVEQYSNLKESKEILDSLFIKIE